MTKIDNDKIRKLRDETGAPVMRVKKVLEDLSGDEKRAFDVLRKEGFEAAGKRAGRATNQGTIASYVHHSGKIASLVELFCETDFVAKNNLFISLGKDLAMQVASMAPKDTNELLGQEFIKDQSEKISDLIKKVVAKTGENVKVGRIFRIELGK